MHSTQTAEHAASSHRMVWVSITPTT